MEKVSPKMAAAMGVGFFGFILAAYSYNKYHKPEYTDEVNTIDKNEEMESRGKEIKEEVKQSIEKKKSMWKTFWEGEYTKINKTAGSENESTEKNESTTSA